MRFALAGFAGSGKTTLFNAMTGLDVPVGFGGEPRVGTVRVPDPRVDALTAMYRPRKTTYATMSLRDVPGEHGGGGRLLSAATLQHIRDCEAICLVLRDFTNPALDAPPDPLGELRAFNEECLLSDLGIAERRLDRLRKERAPFQEIRAFETALASLEAERPLRLVPREELHRRFVRGYGFLTELPLLTAVNVAEDRAGDPLDESFTVELAGIGGAAMVLSAAVETEIAGLDPDDQAEFLADMGLAEPALARFIRAAYDVMDLISFFTASPREVAARTLRRGMTARQAAGRVHSDLERGFIRAEVMRHQDLLELGSEQAVKEAGRFRVEGRSYVVQDGEIVHVRFNV